MDTSVRSGGDLVRRLVEVPARSHLEGTAGAGGELWFVLGGAGALEVNGNPAIRLRPDQGLWIPPHSGFRAHADGSADLRLDMVALPDRAPDPAATGSNAPEAMPLIRDLDQCEVETTGNRQFRVLFGPGRGCSVATQFVGEIPPGRAPVHSHPYDEVVLVLAGHGVAHAGGADHPIQPGTSMHLPPGSPHCLENTGSATLRVLGIFHPADSPAAKLQAG